MSQFPQQNQSPHQNEWIAPPLQAAPLGLTVQQAPVRTFVPPTEGERIWSNNITYFIGRIIDSGAFGTVYECVDEWGNELAAKVISPQSQTYEQVRAIWHAELMSLLYLRHPNITYVHAAFEFRDTFYIVMERCAMTLSAILLAPGLNGELWLPHVARHVLHALHFIHGSGYVHKDLHAGNILVSHQRDAMAPWKDPVWQFKVADLGISNLEGNIRQSGSIVAQWIMPPECLNHSEFGAVGRHVDIYHVGLLLLNLIHNKELHFGRQDILDGVPRQLAEAHSSPYAPAIARALRRHVSSRTQSAIELWREVSATAASLRSQQT
ncbi:protein kinase family protein [Parapusillimonas sp. JC17]|uniref:protein kinase family protein n=1 Tax=Parapusillimonas sp. JC17 TaxID=3445768 RepID=UPI003FA0A926